MTIGLISIIMAAYNAERTIKEAIESVIHQTYRNWELIVVNDGSNDATADVVKAFHDSRIILIDCPENRGISKSRKVGLDASHGEWISVLDSDDLWKPDKLEKQVIHAENTGAALLFTGVAFIDHDGKPRNWILHVPQKLRYHKLLKQNLIPNSSSLVKKELYQKHYAVGDNMHEDFAIWLGITREGYDAYGIDEPLLIYRITSASKSHNKFKAAKMNWNTYKYMGLNSLLACYYMCWYAINGLNKQINLLQ